MSLLELVCQQVNACFTMLEKAENDEETIHLLGEMERYIGLLKTEITVRQEAIRDGILCV